MIVALVVILTVIIHKVYIRVIRRGVQIIDSHQAVTAWFVCFVIALVICGAMM
jgi:hypothetical protein